jgi:hypothetical protein
MRLRCVILLHCYSSSSFEMLHCTTDTSTLRNSIWQPILTKDSLVSYGSRRRQGALVLFGWRRWVIP